MNSKANRVVQFCFTTKPQERKSACKLFVFLVFLFILDFYVFVNKDEKVIGDKEWNEGKKVQFKKTLERLRKRRDHLVSICSHHRDAFRIEDKSLSSSAHHDTENSTSTQFSSSNQTFDICNVHHGGMASWRYVF